MNTHTAIGELSGYKLWEDGSKDKAARATITISCETPMVVTQTGNVDGKEVTMTREITRYHKVRATLWGDLALKGNHLPVAEFKDKKKVHDGAQVVMISHFEVGPAPKYYENLVADSLVTAAEVQAAEKAAQVPF